MPHPEFLPSPVRDRVGYFHHDRFRGYLAVHCCSGLQPPCLRFAMAVAGHHARLGTRLRARLCRGLHFRKLNSMSFQGTTRTVPDGRSLAHPVLIADDWRRSERRDRDGAHAVEVAIVDPAQASGSTVGGVAGCGDEEFATTVPAIGPGIRPSSPGFPVPHSS